MTIAERLRTISQAIRGQSEVKTIIKEKGVPLSSSGVVDIFKNSAELSNYKSVSTKLIKANEGWVYKNNDAVSKEVGNIEFELFRVKQVGGELVFDPIVVHPLLEALDRFNDFTSKTSGFYLTESHQNLAGDAFWFIDGKGINIKGIYLLQPDKVELKLGDPSYGQYIIQEYIYKDTVDGKQVKETYDSEDIVHFKQPDPGNPYRGKSKVEAAAQEIDSDNLATIANKRLYQQGLIANFILTTEKIVTPEQAKQIEAKLKSNNAGVANAYKTLILGSGLKPETLNLTNKEMETIALQKWYRDKIMSVFGNTPSSIGIVEDVNRANAESGILHWKRTTIKSEMKTITDTINEFLLPRFGDNLVLGFKDPVPEDRDSLVEENVKLAQAKIITQNEARQALGYDPVNEEEADQLNRYNPLVPLTEENIPKSIRNITFSRHLSKMKSYKSAVKHSEIKAKARPLAKKIIENRNKARAKKANKKELVSKPTPRKLDSDIVRAFHEKQFNIVDVNETVFQQKVENYILLILEEALPNIPDEVANAKGKALVDEESLIVRAGIDLAPVLLDVATQSGEEAMRIVSDDDVYVPQNLNRKILRQVRKFAKSMIETDQQKIVDTIARGVEEGKAIPVIRNELIQEFEGGYAKSQAEKVTRTEVLRASNEGAIDSWKESGVVTGKAWSTALDDRVDEDCAEMEGVVVELDTSFNSSIVDILGSEKAESILSYGSVGQPPLHPNCRCSLEPILVE